MKPRVVGLIWTLFTVLLLASFLGYSGISRAVIESSSRPQELSVDGLRLGPGTPPPQGKVELAQGTDGTMVRMDPNGSIIEIEGRTLCLGKDLIAKSGCRLKNVERRIRLTMIDSSVPGVFIWTSNEQKYWIKTVCNEKGAVLRIGMGLGPVPESLRRRVR